MIPFFDNYLHAKKTKRSTDSFHRYQWTKNPAIWLAESILGHNWRTRFTGTEDATKVKSYVSNVLFTKKFQSLSYALVKRLRQVTGPLFWCYIGLRPDFDKTQQNRSEEKTNKHQQTPDVDYFLLITNIVFVFVLL